MIELPVAWILATIDQLQKDVERMAKGCGIDHCLWRSRGGPEPFHG